MYEQRLERIGKWVDLQHDEFGLGRRMRLADTKDTYLPMKSVLNLILTGKRSGSNHLDNAGPDDISAATIHCINACINYIRADKI